MSRIRPTDLQIDIQETAGISTMETLFRSMAHRSEIAEQSMHLLQTIMRTGTVDPRLKELLAIRVSQVNHCYY